jgi:hypothetical protein
MKFYFKGQLKIVLLIVLIPIYNFSTQFNNNQKSHSSYFEVKSKMFKKLLEVMGLNSLLEAQQEKLQSKDYLEILNENLQKIWRRKLQKERWELPSDKLFLDDYKKILKDEYIKNNLQIEPKVGSMEEIIKALKNIGIWNEVSPKGENPFDAALVLGAAYDSFKLRLEYLINLIEEKNIRLKTIYFLSGERPLDPAIEKDIIEEMTENNIEQKTEKTMMEYVAQKILSEDFKKKFKIIFVNTPDQKKDDGTFRRANTKDTLVEFLKKNQTDKKLLIISNAPFIGYQKEIVRNTLPKEKYSSFIAGSSFEVLDKIKDFSTYDGKKIFISVALDNIARIIYMKVKNEAHPYPH